MPSHNQEPLGPLLLCICFGVQMNLPESNLHLSILPSFQLAHPHIHMSHCYRTYHRLTWETWHLEDAAQQPPGLGRARPWYCHRQGVSEQPARLVLQQCQSAIPARLCGHLHPIHAHERPEHHALLAVSPIPAVRIGVLVTRLDNVYSGTHGVRRQLPPQHWCSPCGRCRH